MSTSQPNMYSSIYLANKTKIKTCRWRFLPKSHQINQIHRHSLKLLRISLQKMRTPLHRLHQIRSNSLLISHWRSEELHQRISILLNRHQLQPTLQRGNSAFEEKQQWTRSIPPKAEKIRISEGKTLKKYLLEIPESKFGRWQKTTLSNLVKLKNISSFLQEQSKSRNRREVDIKTRRIERITLIEWWWWKDDSYPKVDCIYQHHFFFLLLYSFCSSSIILSIIISFSSTVLSPI